MNTVHDILRAPHVTEKSTLQKEQSEGLTVTFEVRSDASKRQINTLFHQVTNDTTFSIACIYS